MCNNQQACSKYCVDAHFNKLCTKMSWFLLLRNQRILQNTLQATCLLCSISCTFFNFINLRKGRKKGCRYTSKNTICYMRGVRKYNPSSNVWLTSPFLMGLKVAQTRLVSPDKGMVQHQRRIGSIRITSFEKKNCTIFFSIYSTSMPSYHLFIKLHLLLTYYYLLGLYQESK